jgi:DNA polymerase elongation subunit (family B)
MLFKLLDFVAEDREDEFVVQMFGTMEDGKTVSACVSGYHLFFFVQCGQDWNDTAVSLFIKHIKDSMKLSITGKLLDYKKLYGFTAGNKSKFMKLTFATLAVFKRVRALWYTGYGEKQVMKRFLFRNTLLIPYESNLPPLLRFFHLLTISPSGWISVSDNAKAVSFQITSCDIEIKCSVVDLRSVPEKDVAVPYKICSFDIEASSSHGDFPVPVKTYRRLAIDIVSVFNKQKRSIRLSSPSPKEALVKLINMLVKAGLGLGKFQDISPVYLKKAITLVEFEMMMEFFFSHTIEISSTVKKKITIEAMFANKKEEVNANIDGDLDLDQQQQQHQQQSYGEFRSIEEKRSTSTSTARKINNIMDILCSDECTDDHQVDSLNEVLTQIFPGISGDEVTFIGSTFLRYGDAIPYRQHCLVVNTCDKVEGVEIYSYGTERKILEAWTQLINEENPDIIIGYNIFGFDYEFMYQRSLETKCDSKFLQLSRQRQTICLMKNTNTKFASGEYDLKYPEIAGRLQIDMYMHFRRDVPMSSYKLDDVVGQYICDEIRSIERVDPVCVALLTRNVYGLCVRDYIHIEISGFTSDYYEGGRKYKVVQIVDRGGGVNAVHIESREEIMLCKNMKWCIAKDDVSPHEIFRLTKGTSADRAIIAKYCIQDCNLVMKLFIKIDVLTGYIEMASICSVPMTYLVFRGQGIKLTSYVAKKCMEHDTLMPDLPKILCTGGYEGAIVLPPKCAMYLDNPIACVDYASLYPSTMISQNYSHDSKVWTKVFDLEGKLIKETGETENGVYIYDNLIDYKYIDVIFDVYENKKVGKSFKEIKTKVGTKTCRWAQLPHGKKSIMPCILEELLKARSDTRKKIKEIKDPFLRNILDKRQLGYKVTANSLYGQCGAKTSTFYEQDIAASTTATGRLMIIYAQNMIEKVYGNLQYNTECHGPVHCHAEHVYGDTDSVFFTFNLKDMDNKDIRGRKALEITIEIAQDVAKLCTRFLKPPMELTYEKTMMQFILLAKKRYVGMLYETDADPGKGKMKFMGLAMKRRDSCDYLKDVYGDILAVLMRNDESIDAKVKAAVNLLDTSLLDLQRGSVSMEKLTITKALRSNYKNPLQIAHNVLAQRIAKRDPGNKPKPGERMKYVHIVNDSKLKTLNGDKIETPFFIDTNPSIKIDYTYYITNQLMNPIQQLLMLSWKQILQEKKVNLSKIKIVERDLLLADATTCEKKKKAIVKSYLFDPHIQAIYLKNNRIETIDTHFDKQ